MLPSSYVVLQVPMQIIQRPMISHGGSMVAQGKVVWSDMDPDLATWEDLEALQFKFPHAPACGQAGSQRGENVSAPGGPVADRTTGEKSRRGSRARRPSIWMMGPEWA
ncbi:hypothetical protein QOZ80_4AG0323910 [Eleusine coracana subsp. coracana]|nr:hypothetical protein QOZ80_4AG0323910 [Eleusine coracana subsp. coracana]